MSILTRFNKEDLSKIQKIPSILGRTEWHFEYTRIPWIISVSFALGSPEKSLSFMIFHEEFISDVRFDPKWRLLVLCSWNFWSKMRPWPSYTPKCSGRREESIEPLSESIRGTPAKLILGTNSTVSGGPEDPRNTQVSKLSPLDQPKCPTCVVKLTQGTG